MFLNLIRLLVPEILLSLFSHPATKERRDAITSFHSSSLDISSLLSTLLTLHL